MPHCRTIPIGGGKRRDAANVLAFAFGDATAMQRKSLDVKAKVTTTSPVAAWRSSMREQSGVESIGGRVPGTGRKDLSRPPRRSQRCRWRHRSRQPCPWREASIGVGNWISKLRTAVVKPMFGDKAALDIGEWASSSANLPPLKAGLTVRRERPSKIGMNRVREILALKLKESLHALSPRIRLWSRKRIQLASVDKLVRYHPIFSHS